MENVVLVILIITTASLIIRSIWMLFKHPGIKEHLMPASHLLILFIVYGTIISGFGLIYALISLMGYPVIKLELNQSDFFSFIEACIYFSSTTILSVGYGDIVPVGAGRWIAALQALIGYLLPIAFVLSSVVHHNKMAK
ncbi:MULTISPECIES: ion channel [Fictibacillus]|jgi:potassium channel LctB|uniref:ion channel n=1 Tax=Fictibacillus TaxID=1329200 RepID=UPI0018CEB22F|nr:MULTISPECIES: ion channel [unclassified Fictibacillus]MBH0158820.1 two pore domain potassium channel family protein [Fictibacillus sp. 5RED26]MBH0162908.1 two pore domain potassium channel family protein [Fictibacillus sp. 26RED30]MBH0167338.1 two pore domain potassium channel family protein [Fictibacillus sp. 7GRE50]MBH0175057.1 two pore domain potassium channel family protein [Fictibacillus sp. 23RED33]